MIDTSNPAGRLYLILVSARKQSERAKVRDVWAKALDCSPQDDAEISKRVVELYNLAQDVRRLIKLIPDLNHDLYLSSFHKIDKSIFPLNLDTNWQVQRSALSEEIITRVQFCAEELGKHYAEESIDPEDLSEIEALLIQTFELVEISKIEPTLRMAILEELERIRSALTMYKIKGAKGVKESLQSLFGAVVVNRDGLASLQGVHDSVLERLGKLIDKLDTFTARALKIKRILSGPVAAALAFLSEKVNQDRS